MANLDYPHGLRPITFGARVRRYEVDSSNSPRIGLYDPVKMQNDGHVAKAAADSDATPTNVILGVVVGIFNFDGEPIRYLPTATAGWVSVCDDPDALFVIQDDDSDTPTVAIVGANADITTASCNITTGVSTVQLAVDGVATTASLQLRIVALWLDPANSWDAVNADVIVQINTHFYTATAGI